jgi:hypothetical protein
MIMATIRETYAERLIRAGGKYAAKQSSKYLVIAFPKAGNLTKVLLGKSGAFRVSRNGLLSDSGSVSDPEKWLQRHGA